MPTPAPAPQAATPAPDGIRLSGVVRPRAYRLALEVDPNLTEFRGRAAIDVTVREAVNPLWLNGENLTIEAARVRTAAGTRSLSVVAGPEGVIGLAGTEVFAPGEATLEIEYRGVQSRDQSDGVLRAEEAGAWYLVTDLEPLGARRIFPSFDEPGFKVPWQLELTVPAGLLAAGNTPIVAEETLADGRRRVQFAPSQPLPTYLFAFAVGPFDAVDAGKTRGGAPMRILVPRGRAADAAWMAKQSAPIVEALEDYTGVPYPYEKIDHVVIPGRSGGAMENVGLITYAPRLLLIPDGEPAEVRRRAVSVVAHELAHQWFGNLVTLAWWDDLWLNEAFASWAGDKVMAERYAELGGDHDAIATRRWALDSEWAPTARAIRQPIAEKVDIGRAFDGITYSKGATVIRMFEEWLGRDKFRAGIRRYLERHRGGNAAAADLLAALGDAAGVDVGTPMSSWLDQPGAPVVSMALECPAGGPARLALSQRRYEIAASGATASTTRWQIPVCVRLPGEKAPRCTLLTEATGQLALGAGCPKAIIPAGVGHYRAALTPALRTALLRAWPTLSAAEQTALVADTAALIDTQQADVAALLDLMPRIGASRVPAVAAIGVEQLIGLGAIISEADAPAFARLVQASFGKVARKSGWLPRAGDDRVAATVRPALLQLVADAGRDPGLARDVAKLARRWLEDPRALPESMWSSVLITASRLDDGTLFELLLSRMTTHPSIAARRAIAQALGATRDPARYRRALEHVRDLGAIPGEVLPVLYTPDRVATQRVLIGFLSEHGATVLGKIQQDSRRWMAPSTCHAELREDLAALLDAHFVSLPLFGASARTRRLAELDTCAATRAHRQPQLAAYLKKRR